MLLLALLSCGEPPPEPEPPPPASARVARSDILAARHRFDDRIALPAPFDGALVASRDGSRFAVRLQDGAVHVHDADGAPRFVVRGTPGAARVITWADDGSRLAIGGTERVTVIDADGGRVAEWNVEKLRDAALSPRGASLVVSAGEMVTWYDATTGEIRWERPYGGGPVVFASPQEAIIVSDGQALRRLDRLGTVQAEREHPGIVEIAASQRWLRTLDASGRSTPLSTADLLPATDPPRWPRRIQQLVAGPNDHWLVDGAVIPWALAPEPAAAFVSRDAVAGAFVLVNRRVSLWLAVGDTLERWSLWRPPRVTAVPVPEDVSRVTFVGAVPEGPFVLGSDDGRVWGVPADGLDRVAWTKTLPQCPSDPDLGCLVLDVGGKPDQLEIATDQAAYVAKRGKSEALRVARLKGTRGALAMPDGRWVSWTRDAVRVGPRAGRGPRVGPPLDVPQVAVAGRYHAVVWDSAIVLRNARGRPMGKRWPIPYDSFPKAIAVSPDGNVLAAAFEDGVSLFFVESGFARKVLPTVRDVHGLEFGPRGETLLASGDGVTRIVVNRAEAMERWSLAAGPRVDATQHHPDLGRVAVLQHDHDGPSIVVLPPQ
ncbi:MAG: hypothetical protein AAGA48_19290 [Myxococcota bacterium]